jgi:GNAT superfamily N-acetyltransferase
VASISGSTPLGGKRWRTTSRPETSAGWWRKTAGSSGTITVDDCADEEFWRPEDDPDDALYLHRMVTTREVAGREIGSALLDWASCRAAALRKRWVRLDAWRSNPGLQRYYADRGFEHVRTVQLPHRHSGALFQRRAGVVRGDSPRVAKIRP